MIESTIDGFDELTEFVCGEDEQHIVEYILMDDGGFCHRASPFLMPVGTVFEHNFGTYQVQSIDRKPKTISVFCVRLDSDTPMFNQLFELRKNFN